MLLFLIKGFSSSFRLTCDYQVPASEGASTLHQTLPPSELGRRIDLSVQALGDSSWGAGQDRTSSGCVTGSVKAVMPWKQGPAGGDKWVVRKWRTDSWKTRAVRKYRNCWWKIRDLWTITWKIQNINNLKLVLDSESFILATVILNNINCFNMAFQNYTSVSKLSKSQH